MVTIVLRAEYILRARSSAAFARWSRGVFRLPQAELIKFRLQHYCIFGAVRDIPNLPGSMPSVFSLSFILFPIAAVVRPLYRISLRIPRPPPVFLKVPFCLRPAAATARRKRSSDSFASAASCLPTGNSPPGLLLCAGLTHEGTLHFVLCVQLAFA